MCKRSRIRWKAHAAQVDDETECFLKNIIFDIKKQKFSVINVRQMRATRRAPNRQTHVEPLPLFLVALTRNIS
jgi:hypothetical protein